MKIKVLVSGCSKCNKTYETVKKTVEEINLNADVTKVEDIIEIMKYNVLSTPSIVIDEKVAMTGKLPTSKEIIDLIEKYK